MDRREWCRLVAAAGAALLAAPVIAGPDTARTGEIEQLIEAWRLAWELGEWPAYQRFYDAGFQGHAPSRAQWERERRERLARKDITVKLENVRVELEDAFRADVRFVQHYIAPEHTDSGDKRLRLVRSDGAWRITQEDWKPRR